MLVARTCAGTGIVVDISETWSPGRGRRIGELRGAKKQALRHQTKSSKVLCTSRLVGESTSPVDGQLQSSHPPSAVEVGTGGDRVKALRCHESALIPQHVRDGELSPMARRRSWWGPNQDCQPVPASSQPIDQGNRPIERVRDGGGPGRGGRVGGGEGDVGWEMGDGRWEMGDQQRSRARSREEELGESM